MNWFKRFIWAAAAGLGLAALSTAGTSFAADYSVRVTLPTFDVTLNGHKVENEYREYPLIVYKDITYFPMTWYDSRLLGLKTAWSEGDGLAVAKESVSSSYHPYQSERKQPRVMKATIPAFAISVNGQKVDNAREEYPLLICNDITYFPLTWKYAHDDFGWKYVWTPSEGLRIQSDNPQITNVALPSYAGDNDVALHQGYYYFVETEGDTNRIYRAPEADPSAKELVYSYNGASMYEYNKRLKFSTRDNELWFSYHHGGVTMGSDVYGRIDGNGKASVVHQGYLDFKSAPYGTLIIRQFFPPTGNNLELLKDGQKVHEGAPVGNPELIYGWSIRKLNGIGYGPVQSTVIVGGDAYVLASPYPVEKDSEVNRIYRVNLATGETVKLIDADVRDFQISGDTLYYLKETDRALYSAKLDGTNERKQSDRPVADWFGEIDGFVYYTAADANGRLQLYQANPSGEDTPVLSEFVDSVQIGDGQLICRLAEGEDDGMKILDASGKLLVTAANRAADVWTDGDAILFTDAADKSIKRLDR